MRNLLRKLHLYNLAVRLYNIWVWIFDEIYYFLNPNDTIKRIRPYTMVGREGLLATYEVTKHIVDNNIDGCFVECGVARGGCSALMALVGKDRMVWMFDTYEGLPKPGKQDTHYVSSKDGNRKDPILKEGYCLGTYREVSGLMFGKLKLSPSRIQLVKGLFNVTLPRYKNKIGKIAILRIDADWYKSTKCVLENLYRNVGIGGFVIIDDYHALSGCGKAVNEFLAKIEYNPTMIYDNRGGVYFEKLHR